MFQNRNKVLKTLQSSFYHKSVLVVGDIMLDRYLWGGVSRVSPEAPVPVVLLDRETESAGAAANVALNLSNLGIHARLVGLVGDDSEGDRLLELIALSVIDGSSIQILKDWPTTTKTRVIGGHQQMLRIDREDTKPIAKEAGKKLLQQILKQLNLEPTPGAVILSDYGKGVLSEEICQAIIESANKMKIPILVDPKGVNYKKYRGATTLTPNRKELATALPFPIEDLPGLLSAGEKMCDDLNLDFLTVTLSEQGIALLDTNSGPKRIPAVTREVYDVSGAGDTVVSTFAAGLAVGLDKMDALHLANLAAGVVVGKVGTTPINQLDLIAALSSEEAMGQSAKICTLQSALTQIEGWKKAGDKIVFTNGCFDLLHTGHVTYMEDARNLGSRLIIGLNTDKSVRKLKGPSRPIIHEKDRARVLAAMASVDMVILFDEETPLTLINSVRPDILAKGADYTEETVVGASQVKSWGGQVALIPLVEGHSSSRIMDNIKTPKE
ncbi:MAG: D-glycero-beta-D-manno-heptose-7-phosphate kinase [Magnetococcales bacterium]|nr:D-glycero-beta-D-manno-heptose-7-phosphate kinase [Magnetococcales bacterium]